ncbi:unnamed protein product [Prunus armeniaca]
MVRQIGVCSVSHIYKERNAVADCLAKWSHNLDLGLCVLDVASNWLDSLLVDDLLGVPRTRWPDNGFERKAIRCLSWERTAPSPLCEASHSTVNGLEKSDKESTRVEDRVAFSASKAVKAT